MKRLRESIQTRRWLVPEVVQTSVMDCGPAALTSLLEGFYIPTSYGRLREACQTSVDGTSIDVMEVVSRQLGLDAEQIMLPADYLWIPEAEALPAVVVVSPPSGLLHFVIVWRRVGRWLQIMDPGVGRRWTTCDRFSRELHLHSVTVSATDWYEWATSDATSVVFLSRLRSLGASGPEAGCLVQRAKAQGAWHAIAGLDAALRMVECLTSAGGLRRGAQAVQLLEHLSLHASQQLPDTCQAVPARYWSVVPAAAHGEISELSFRGAVLLRIRGRTSQADALEGQDQLAPELAAALQEPRVHPLRELGALMRGEGVLTPLAIMGAIGLGVGAVLLESLLFRGLFEFTNVLTVTNQRMFALGALISFIVLLWVCELPIVTESLRIGRHLEVRLRSALLNRLPTLNDRYLQSRPISDMAERSHSLSIVRTLPDLAVRCIQSCWEIIMTVIGIWCIAPHSGLLALILAGFSLLVTAVSQRPVCEADLRVRGHAGALYGFYLDALRGIAPIRIHSAQRAVCREHESLLTDWVRSATRLLTLSVVAQGIQSIVSFGLVGVLVFEHLHLVGVTGSLLLLVYWALKLPALSGRIVTLALQYPAQRNVVLRLLEPLNAPNEAGPVSEHHHGEVSEPPVVRRQVPDGGTVPSGVAIDLQQVTVVAAGHKILHDVSLRVEPGEHLAIVGPSGAGKSSLIGLLLGWYRADGGHVLIDQEGLTPARLQQVRCETAWVDPAIQLWNRSLLENLAYSHKAGSYSTLGDLLESADLTNVVTRLPNGLQSCLGEGGAHLSGGEGQRVRVARAMWQSGVRLALLDEPFRGLDRARRLRHLAQARQVWKEATLLCVTHDVAETHSFDRVVVIEHGRIVEDGSPEQLAENPASRYRALLEAEDMVSQAFWAGEMWRRLRIEQGRVHEASSAGDVVSIHAQGAMSAGGHKVGHG